MSHHANELFSERWADPPQVAPLVRAPATLDGILAGIASYRVVHVCSVHERRAVGFVLLATATRPHFTLRDGNSATTLDPERFLEVLGRLQPNPYHRRAPTGR